MKIETGLFEHMVLQRTPRNVSDARITGTSTVAGNVHARVTVKDRTLPGFGAKTVGKATGGKFTANLAGLPVGGPYTITLSIIGKGEAKATEALTVRDVLVGDVWVCGGQSNAEGCGLLADRATPHPMTRAFYMDDHWGVAEDPINRLSDSIDPVHSDLSGGFRPLPNPIIGTGFAVAFGQELQRVTGVPQGIIASSHGGTSMAQWDPAKKTEGSKSLYGATLRRVCKNGSRIAGIVWYQGESDCDSISAPLYVDRMKKLVASFRRDFKNPTLPFACVQIARVVAGVEHASWEAIREAERLLPELIKYFATIPAIDLSLDDGIHISGRDQQIVGKRLAQAMLALVKHPKASRPPITLKKITLEPCPPRETKIIVEFDNVIGKLEAAGRPLGFALIDQHRNQFLFKTQLDGSRAIALTCRSVIDIPDAFFFYGSGVDPVCNVTDSAGRSLPAFGPVKLGEARAITPFPDALEVSAIQAAGGNIHALTYPPDLKALQFTRRTFNERFTHVRPEFLAHAPENVLVYFRCVVDCPEAMKLDVHLGYDGPVKLWIDGKECFFDPDGLNPAIVDHRRIPFVARAGGHEVLVALGSNFGRAWGIFLRFERSDVPLRLIRKGPKAYRMPILC